MDRKNNLRAFERGVRAMMREGIRVKVDLIIGLPGDTTASVRRGLHYVHDDGLCTDFQAFNLSVLPGTAFREDSVRLGLKFQPRPPYYVLETPGLNRVELFELMQEAQDLFGIEFDAQPEPVLDFADGDDDRLCRIDLDQAIGPLTPDADSGRRPLRFGCARRASAAMPRHSLGTFIRCSAPIPSRRSSLSWSLMMQDQRRPCNGMLRDRFWTN